MTKRKSSTINHSDAPVEVTVPEIAPSVAKTDDRVIMPTVTREWLATHNSVDDHTPDIDKLKVSAGIGAAVMADRVEVWNELFFAIKALKANPSEALKASKMGRLLEKLP